jgi:hypothetical protein
LTGGEHHPLEGPQCSDGLRDAGALKSDVKLSYFLAGSGAGVRDGDVYRQWCR